MEASNVYMRGADICAVAESYLDGEFEHIQTWKPVKQTTFAECQELLKAKNEGEEGTHVFSGSGNTTYAFIGHKMYSVPGVYGTTDMSPEKCYNCMHCLRPITWKPIGIPVRRDKVGDKLIYHMIDIFCTYDCGYAELKKRDSDIYAASEALMKELFSKDTGKKTTELEAASDKRILLVYNGMISWNSYHSYSIRYSGKSPNVFFVPVNEYIEQDYRN